MDNLYNRRIIDSSCGQSDPTINVHERGDKITHAGPVQGVTLGDISTLLSPGVVFNMFI